MCLGMFGRVFRICFAGAQHPSGGRGSSLRGASRSDLDAGCCGVCPVVRFSEFWLQASRPVVNPTPEAFPRNPNLSCLSLCTAQCPKSDQGKVLRLELGNAGPYDTVARDHQIKVWVGSAETGGLVSPRRPVRLGGP